MVGDLGCVCTPVGGIECMCTVVNGIDCVCSVVHDRSMSVRVHRWVVYDVCISGGWYVMCVLVVGGM